jgi:tetratricopeptide (TPR) repeat protein
VKRLVQQGVDAYQGGDLPSAIQAWDEACKLDPSNEQADTYLQEGRKRLKDIENDRDAKQHFVLGATHYQNGEIMEAAMEWAAALKCSPEYQEAMEYRGEAVKHLEQETLPDFDMNAPDAAQVLATYRLGVKSFVDLQFFKALQEFRKAQQKRPAYPLFSNLVDLANRHHGDYMNKLNEKAMQALSESRLEDAVVFWRQALENDPEDADTRNALAAAKGTIDQAVSSYYSQAVEYSQANKHREAIRLLEKVVVLDPSHNSAKRRLEESRQKYEKIRGILAQIKE